MISTGGAMRSAQEGAACRGASKLALPAILGPIVLQGDCGSGAAPAAAVGIFGPLLGPLRHHSRGSPSRSGGTGRTNRSQENPTHNPTS